MDPPHAGWISPHSYSRDRNLDPGCRATALAAVAGHWRLLHRYRAGNSRWTDGSSFPAAHRVYSTRCRRTDFLLYCRRHRSVYRPEMGGGATGNGVRSAPTHPVHPDFALHFRLIRTAVSWWDVPASRPELVASCGARRRGFVRARMDCGPRAHGLSPHRSRPPPGNPHAVAGDRATLPRLHRISDASGVGSRRRATRTADGDLNRDPRGCWRVAA